MKIIVSALCFLIVLSNVFFAETVSSYQKESLRGLINRLNEDYFFINKALKELENSLNNYPNTSLTLSVIKKDEDINIVSIEVLDDIYLLQSHIYTPLEKRALEAGGRHQLYSGEIKTGSHSLRIVYYWKDGDNPPEKGEAVINLFLNAGKSYFVKLSFEIIGNKIELDYSLLDFKR